MTDKIDFYEASSIWPRNRGEWGWFTLRTDAGVPLHDLFCDDAEPTNAQYEAAFWWERDDADWTYADKLAFCQVTPEQDRIMRWLLDTYQKYWVCVDTMTPMIFVWHNVTNRSGTGTGALFYRQILSEDPEGRFAKVLPGKSTE